MKFLVQLLTSAFVGGGFMAGLCHATRFIDRAPIWYDVPGRFLFELYGRVWSIFTLNKTWTDDVVQFGQSYSTFLYIASGLVAFFAFWILWRRFPLSAQLWKPFVVLFALAHTPLAGIVGEPFAGGTLFGFVAVGLMAWGVGMNRLS